jgi:Family of unknown function (DUF6056)
MHAVPGVRGRLVVLVSGAIMLALFLVLASVALASWPTADDYCSRVLVAERGVSGALHWLFFEWSGRLVTGIPLYLIFASVDLPSLRWISVALVCLFVVAAYQVGSLVAGEDLPLRWPLSAFALAAFSLGLYRLIGQTVLWATGGIVYALPLVLALLWLTAARRLLRGGESSSGNLYGFALGVLVGDSIELVLPIIGAYIVLVAPSRWNKLSPSARRALGWLIAGVVVGAAVLIAAPGNYGRVRFTPGSFRVDPIYLAGE